MRAVLVGGMIVAAVSCLAGDDPTAGLVNLAQNPGFEQGALEDGQVAAGWDFWALKKPTARIVPQAGASGTPALELGVQGEKSAFMATKQTLPVTPGKTYIFQASVRSAPVGSLAGSAHGSLGIEWVDSDGAELERVSSERWDASLSRLRWTTVRASGKAPQEAAEARFVIHFSDGESGGSGTCYVDDVTIAEQ